MSACLCIHLLSCVLCFRAAYLALIQYWHPVGSSSRCPRQHCRDRLSRFHLFGEQPLFWLVLRTLASSAVSPESSLSLCLCARFNLSYREIEQMGARKPGATHLSHLPSWLLLQLVVFALLIPFGKTQAPLQPASPASFLTTPIPGNTTQNATHATNATLDTTGTYPPRGTIHKDAASIVACVVGVLVGAVLALRGYRINPRLTLFISGTKYFGLLAMNVGIAFAPTLLPMIHTRAPNYPAPLILALVPLGVALFSGLILGILPTKWVRRCAPLLLAATWTLMIQALVMLDHPSPWIMLVVQIVLTIVSLVWSIWAFRGVVSCATAMAGSWLMVLSFDIVLNRGVVYAVFAMRSGVDVSQDATVRMAVWLQVAGAFVMGLGTWMAQLVKYQGDWLHDPFQTVANASAVYENKHQPQFLMNA